MNLEIVWVPSEKIALTKKQYFQTMTYLKHMGLLAMIPLFTTIFFDRISKT